MLYRILLVLCITITSTTASALEHVENPCNIDDVYLEIYSRAIRQTFESLVSSGIIDKKDVKTFAIEPNEIVSELNREFETKIFGRACLVRGKGYCFIYDDPSIMEFGIYQLTFSNKEDIKRAVEILGKVKRDFFQTKKIPILFTWHKGGNSIFIIFQEILVGHQSLDHLK